MQKVKVTGKTTAPEKLDLTKWQTYEIICKDNHMIHKINGKVTVDITENHPQALKKGLIGLQLHAGTPMKVWMKNVQLKKALKHIEARSHNVSRFTFIISRDLK